MYIKITKCRLCAVSIHQGCKVFNDKELLHLINKYLQIGITKEDKLPKKICRDCKKTLKTFDDFALKCLQTQEKLVEPTESKNLKVEQIEIEEHLIKGDNFIKLEPILAEELVIRNDLEELKLESEANFFNEDNIFDDAADGDAETIEQPAHPVKSEQSEERGLRGGRKRRLIIPKKKVLKNNIEKEDKDEDYEPRKIKIKQNKIKQIKKSNDNNVSIGRPSVIKYSAVEYVCHICNEKFPRWIPLEEHVASKHDDKPQVICICKDTILSYGTLRKHLTFHFKTGTNVCCTKCDLLFFTESRMQTHMYVVHNVENPHRKFQCMTCDETFKTKGVLRKHEEKHLPRELTHIYSCDECNGMYKTKHQLRSHKQYVHDKASLPKYICNVCGKEYVRKMGLSLHLLTHTKDRIFKCSICPRSFYLKNLLKRHLECHSNIKYRCTVCSMELNSKSTLARHQDVHEDVLRYKCQYCGKQFKRVGDKKHHENRHLGITPYECPWCPKKFVDNSHLRNHKKTQHPKELEEYEVIHGPPRTVLKQADEDAPKIVIPMTLKRKPLWESST